MVLLTSIPYSFKISKWNFKMGNKKYKKCLHSIKNTVEKSPQQRGAANTKSESLPCVKATAEF